MTDLRSRQEARLGDRYTLLRDLDTDGRAYAHQQSAPSALGDDRR